MCYGWLELAANGIFLSYKYSYCNDCCNFYDSLDFTSMKKPNKKRNPFAKQLRHFTSRVIKNKKKYDRKKLEKQSIGY